MTNLTIRECGEALLETLNSFDAPIEAKRLILEVLLTRITSEANMVIAEEARQLKEEKENAESV